MPSFNPPAPDRMGVKAAVVIGIVGAAMWFIRSGGVGDIPINLKATAAFLVATVLVVKVGPRRILGAIPRSWPVRIAVLLTTASAVVWAIDFDPLSLLPSIDIESIIVGFVTNPRVVAFGLVVFVGYVILVRDDGPSVRSIIDRGGVGVQAVVVFGLSYFATSMALGGGVL